MVVVAIIGVLSAIVFRSIQSSRRRRDRVKAKSALSALFTAEESFRQEWNCYTSDLRSIGFGVSGSNLRYITGFSMLRLQTVLGVSVGAPAPGAAGFAISDGGDAVAGAACVLATHPTCFALSPGANWVPALNLATLRTDIVVAAVGTTVAAAGAFTAASIGDPKATLVYLRLVLLTAWTINK